jgi:hypothetical protein
MKDLRLLSEDRRRGRVRPTRLALVGGGVILVLAVALIAFGIRRIQAGGQMRPVVTPTAATAIPPTENAAQASEPTSAPGGCPTDRGEWRLLPYNLPGNETTLYAIDPPCVMEQVERAFLEYLAAYREHGRNWTAQDHEQFYSPAGFTAPLSGDAVHELTEAPAISCVEEVNPDGMPAEYDTHVVFYTISEDGRVADVLYVARPRGAYVTRTYDCETGGLTSEVPNDGTQAFVLYQPLLYEGEGHWRLGHRYDGYEYVPADQIDPQAMVGLILNAQGRNGP